MTKQELIDSIETTLDRLDDRDKVEAWNSYCDEAHYYDDRVYYYDDIDDLFSGMKPTELLELFACSEINTRDDYWKFDGYGNIRTAWNVDSLIDTHDIAVYCADNDDDLMLGDVRDLLDEYAEQDEEDED